MAPAVQLTTIGLIAVGATALTAPPSQRASVGTSDWDSYSFKPLEKEAEVHAYSMTGTYASTGRPFTVYVGLADNPSAFSVVPSDPTSENLCGTFHNTSVTSASAGCQFASNGAFFSIGNADGGCVGALVCDDVEYGLTETGYATFGVASSAGGSSAGNNNNNNSSNSSNNKTVVFGFLSDDDFNGPDALSYHNLLQGRGWLVRRGVSNVAVSPDLDPTSSFYTEKAPRTAVGLYPNGTVALVAVEGREDLDEGPDLAEFAELLADVLHLDSAINLDGGGSETAVFNGSLYNEPHCNDDANICEREVGAITCLKGTIVQ